MLSRQNYFQFEFVFLFDVLFHVFGYFVVEDVFPLVNVCCLESLKKYMVGLYHFCIFA